MRMTVETLKVLGVFVQDPAEGRYGLELIRASGVQAGTLYPILTRLEKAGWLEGDWEDIDEAAEGRRARRYYTLTPLGLREAGAALAEMRRLAAKTGENYA